MSRLCTSQLTFKAADWTVSRWHTRRDCLVCDAVRLYKISNRQTRQVVSVCSARSGGDSGMPEIICQSLQWQQGGRTSESQEISAMRKSCNVRSPVAERFELVSKLTWQFHCIVSRVHPPLLCIHVPHLLRKNNPNRLFMDNPIITLFAIHPSNAAACVHFG